MDLYKEDLARVPLWVTFLHLKLHYYMEGGLSKLASFLGKPLYTNKQTERVSYVRVCIGLAADTARSFVIPYICIAGKCPFLVLSKLHYYMLPQTIVSELRSARLQEYQMVA